MTTRATSEPPAVLLSPRACDASTPPSLEIPRDAAPKVLGSDHPSGNVGRLQLALRSLEVEDVVVRIAVLGERPRRLVAALLADSLEWGGGVVIAVHGVLMMMWIWSRNRNEAAAGLADKDLGGSGGGLEEYPVHKTIVYAGEGAKRLQTLLSGGFTNGGGEVVCKALSFPGIPTELNTGNVQIIDLPLEWLKSGVKQLRQWIFAETEVPNGHNVKPAVKNLVADILDESEALLNEEK
ncbi:hypothetical protein RUND412_010631, partial [Rhizina undulata]